MLLPYWRGRYAETDNMMRFVILVAITVILVLLLARLFPRFRAQVRRVLASPFVRRILFGVVLRIIRLLIFRR